jgi:hypothetical protein
MPRRPMPIPVSILDVMADVRLFASQFQTATWAAWRAFLAALFALTMTAEQLAIYRTHTGRSTPPTTAASEGWLIVGRRGGKSRIAALIAVYLACFRDYTSILAPGEVGTVMLIAGDRRQARTLMRYITGLIDSVPMLASMVVGRTAESLTLSNRIVIEIHTASFRSTRGYTIVAAICDEIAVWRADSDESANPDTEILNAIRPAMSTVPGALLLCISSPRARRGALWTSFKDHFAHDGDPILVWQSDTRSMNPAVSEAVIAEAYARDESSARAEWGGEWRNDLEDFVSHEALTAVVTPGIRERGYDPSHRYVAFDDPSGGSSDSMVLAIAHRENNVAVLDFVHERRAPFDPADVVAEQAAILKRYGIRRVVGDRYAGEWPASRFRENGITYVPAEQNRSELYLSLLPEITSKRVALLDHPRLLLQLGALERRVARAGRDSVDHAPGSHDDLANAVAGALLLCQSNAARPYAGAVNDGIRRIGEPANGALGVGAVVAGQSAHTAAGRVAGQAAWVVRRYR